MSGITRNAAAPSAERPRWAWLAHVAGAVCIIGSVTAMFVPADPTQPPHEATWGSLYATIGIGVFFLVTLFGGWMLAWRRPLISLGWIMLAIPLTFAILPPLLVAGVALIPVNEDLAAWFLLLGGGNSEANMAWALPVGLLMTQLPLRFPTGEPPSPRWRWFSWLTVVAIAWAIVAGSTFPDVSTVGYGIANPIVLPWGELAGLAYLLVFLPLGVAMVGSLASLFVRYRHTDAIERAQLRWVFFGAAVPIVLLLTSWVGSATAPTDDWVLALSTGVVSLSYAFIPASILVAVMRYGLYSIDRIISRAVSYAIVVIVTIGIYAGLVVGLTTLLPRLPSVGVAVATLAAAAAFLPLLRWVRRVVDRRFNRSAYDAQTVVDDFGRHLRDGADPLTAAPALLDAVDGTLQPASVGLWVAKGVQ
ncbi:hypothetical protein [Microbacterium sp.]|uniref:hypothetical protein n=1 Tax=Microbacterium sp. TaxID=51671 RepID=UPI003C72101C